MTPEEFRRYGHQIIDWIADYREQVGNKPVMSAVQPGDIRKAFPAEPPIEAEGFDTLLADVDSKIMPGITHWNHPNFFAYFPSNATLASILGDIMSAGLGGIGLNWQSIPALTELEELMTDWMRQMVGLSSVWEGVIQDTASTSTLVALLCAREQASNYAQMSAGLQGNEAPLVVYSSEQSHSSVKKAALLAGFGLDYVRSIGTDDTFALDVVRLEQAILTDVANGLRPCAVVATTGTTTSTALDPVAEIAGLAERYQMWLHVDAAMAGSAMILPECRWMWQGIERADSMVLNPHKWLGVIFDCSLYYTRKSQHLVRVMSTNPSYLQTATDDEAKNYRDWGIPLGRRFRALKIWCLLRDQGISGLQARLRRDMGNAKWLAEQVEAAPEWEILAPVILQTVCVRHVPPGVSDDALDAHTLRWVNRINQRGAAYLTPSTLNGSWMVRVSIGAEATTREHVAALWSTMLDAVHGN